MYEIPTQITVGEQSFTIRDKGDYRIVLDCFAYLSDDELTEQESLYACLIAFYEAFNDFDDVLKCEVDLNILIEKMFSFFNCDDTNPGIKKPYKVIDWEGDSQLICSAINKVAQQEVRAVEYMHWWTFMGYFCEIGESTLATVVGIREKMMKGKKLEKYEKEFRRDNPQYFVWNSITQEQKKAEELFNQIWDK